MVQGHEGKRSVVTQIMGGELGVFEWIYATLYCGTIVVWPIVAFGSIFLFDAPNVSPFADLLRKAVFTIIIFYPIYFIPILILGSRLSFKYKMRWIYYATPLAPYALIVAFFGVMNLIK